MAEIPRSTAFIESFLSSRDVEVFQRLQTHADAAGWCVCSQVEIARQLGCGRITVQRSLERLAGAGLLLERKSRGPSGECSYRIRRVGDITELISIVRESFEVSDLRAAWRKAGAAARKQFLLEVVSPVCSHLARGFFDACASVEADEPPGDGP